MIDFERVKEFYKVGGTINFSDVQDIFNDTAKKDFNSSEYLIQQDSLKDEIFLVTKGLVRVFILDAKGDDITINLFSEYQIVANMDKILFDKPSRFYYQAVEPTTTLSMSHSKLEKLMSQNSKLEQHRKFVFQSILKDARARVESFILDSPEERYSKFIASNPDINERVPDRYIAHTLGVTPVSLSRIRKRISLKKK